MTVALSCREQCLFQVWPRGALVAGALPPAADGIQNSHFTQVICTHTEPRYGWLKKLLVLFYSCAPKQEKAETNTHLSSKLGHKNAVVTFSVLEVADSRKSEHFIVMMKKPSKPWNTFFLKNYKTGLAAACLVLPSAAVLKTGGPALWISDIFLSRKEQNVFKGNVTEMCMQKNAFKGFTYVCKQTVDL